MITIKLHLVCLYECCDVPGNWDMRVAVWNIIKWGIDYSNVYVTVNMTNICAYVRLVYSLICNLSDSTSSFCTVAARTTEHRHARVLCAACWSDPAHLQFQLPCWACVIVSP